MLPRDDVTRAVRLIAAAAVRGAGDPAVRSYLADVARRSGARDPLDVLAHAYADLSDGWVRLADPPDREWIRDAADVLADRSGDCDDGAVLAGALALALGLDARLEVLREDGEAFHVRASALGDRWLPLDLADGAPFGVEAWSGAVEAVPLPSPAGGLGFLPVVAALATAAAGIGSALIGRDAARDQGRAARDAASAQADATRYASDRQLQAARAQALALSDQALAAERIAGTSAAVAWASMQAVLGTLRAVWPSLAVVLALAAVVPVLKGGR